MLLKLEVKDHPDYIRNTTFLVISACLIFADNTIFAGWGQGVINEVKYPVLNLEVKVGRGLIFKKAY